MNFGEALTLWTIRLALAGYFAGLAGQATLETPIIRYSWNVNLVGPNSSQIPMHLSSRPGASVIKSSSVANSVVTLWSRGVCSEFGRQTDLLLIISALRRSPQMSYSRSFNS